MILMAEEITGTTKVRIEVTLFEAAAIQRLREFEYGRLIIHKQANQPTRISTEVSDMIDFRKGRDLAIE